MEPREDSTTDHATAAAAPEVRRRRGRPRDPETDRRILAAAADLLLHRGFDRMTVDDVAARAGVGKATVYRRWASKEDLAVAAMEKLFSVELPQIDSGSIVEDLTHSYRATLAFVNSPEGSAFLRMSVAEAIRDERIAALYRASSERTEAEATRMYERAVDRGEVRPDLDIPAAVHTLIGILVYRTISGRALPTMADLDGLVELTLRGVHR